MSVSAVRVSPDLSIARVYLSIFPPEKSHDILENIKKQTKTVRYELAQAVKQVLRKCPDLQFFLDLSKTEEPEGGYTDEYLQNDLSLTVIVPSFMISELKRAFQMGFLIFLPFLVIDLVVGSTLMSMGMMMLPPAMISMPFKILVFVLADGWNLLIGSVVASYNL